MFAARLPWYVAGPLIGVLMIGLRATLNKPFGALGGFIDIAENGAAPLRFSYSAWLLLGLVAGGALYTVGAGSTPTLAYGTGGGLLPEALPG
jgi:uncharacterized protein